MSSEEAAAIRALASLKDADRNLEAPPSLERRLLEEYRRRQVRRGWTGWSLFASLAAGVALVLYVDRSASPRPASPVSSVPSVQQVAQSPASVPSADHQVRPARPALSSGSVRHASPPREIVTEFFPLMDAAPPLGRGQLLRVAVTRSAMRTVGLPVREERLDERVEADVLIGEEGMARAIRFVSLQQ